MGQTACVVYAYVCMSAFESVLPVRVHNARSGRVPTRGGLRPPRPLLNTRTGPGVSGTSGNGSGVVTVMLSQCIWGLPLMQSLG